MSQQRNLSKYLLWGATAIAATAAAGFLLYKWIRKGRVCPSPSEVGQRFDLEAKTYDNRDHQKALCANLKVLISKLHITKDMDVLDFAAGTGSATLNLAQYARSVLAVDLSAGMLEQLQKKIAEEKLTNVKTWKKELQTVDDLPDSKQRFDLIFSSMAFHHLPNPASSLKMLFSLLKEDGVVAFCDLALSPVSVEFHKKEKRSDVVTPGFELKALARTITDAGFTDVKINESAFTLFKEGYDHPIFLATASKKSSL
eukprot:TRINITY_DN1401_c0_g1_i1.p1 TRINITY_DN1401_c0_g1~~TRINITY_DN1401_c0_g1_i1.p1  ORF type:complete len:256 (+),score=54.69 TRINITY_DN1401_c0_g1_i1:28-795(+)